MDDITIIHYGVDFKAKYDLRKYEGYLREMTVCTSSVQKSIKNIAKKINSTVMQQGKWYDDCASEFAQWWNDEENKQDGIDQLKGINTKILQILARTGAECCSEFKNSKQTRTTINKGSYPYIKKYASAREKMINDPIACPSPLERISKKSLGQIAITRCKQGVPLEIDSKYVNPLINTVSKELKNINAQTDKIKKLVTTNIIQSNAISLDGFDSSDLKKAVNSIKSKLNDIQSMLVTTLKTDASIGRNTTKLIKEKLSQTYGKVK